MKTTKGREEIEDKKCIRCKEIKLVSDFPPNRRICVKCRNIIEKERHRVQRDKIAKKCGEAEDLSMRDKLKSMVILVQEITKDYNKISREHSKYKKILKDLQGV